MEETYSITPQGLALIRAIRKEYMEKAARGEELTAHEMYVVGMLDNSPSYADASDKEVEEGIMVLLEKAHYEARGVEESALQ